MTSKRKRLCDFGNSQVTFKQEILWLILPTPGSNIFDWSLRITLFLKSLGLVLVIDLFEVCTEHFVSALSKYKGGYLIEIILNGHQVKRKIDHLRFYFSLFMKHCSGLITLIQTILLSSATQFMLLDNRPSMACSQAVLSFVLDMLEHCPPLTEAATLIRTSARNRSKYSNIMV